MILELEKSSTSVSTKLCVNLTDMRSILKKVGLTSFKLFPETSQNILFGSFIRWPTFHRNLTKKVV